MGYVKPPLESRLCQPDHTLNLFPTVYTVKSQILSMRTQNDSKQENVSENYFKLTRFKIQDSEKTVYKQSWYGHGVMVVMVVWMCRVVVVILFMIIMVVVIANFNEITKNQMVICKLQIQKFFYPRQYTTVINNIFQTLFFASV